MSEGGGKIIGKYWVRWLGGDEVPSNTLIPAEVRRFGDGYYAVRLAGRGYFRLHEFEWHGDYKSPSNDV